MKGKRPGDARILWWRVVCGWGLLALIEADWLHPTLLWGILAALDGICLGIPPIALGWMMDVWFDTEEEFTYYKLAKPEKVVGPEQARYTFIGYVKEIFK